MATVAIAWIGAATTDAARGAVLELYAKIGAEHHWTVYRWNRAVSTRIISRSWSGFGGGPYREGRPEILLAGWGRIEPPDPATTETVTQVDEAWGFPLKAMACGVRVIDEAGGAVGVSTDAMWRLGGRAAGGGYDRYLPLRPLVWGLVVNSALYAVLSLVVYAAARDATRFVSRRRRPACG
ncbi:MAG: hypothetical protein ACYS0D_13340 [Planctomycetota bacterium]|jgi:hypothetical protein